LSGDIYSLLIKNKTEKPDLDSTLHSFATRPSRKLPANVSKAYTCAEENTSNPRPNRHALLGESCPWCGFCPGPGPVERGDSGG
jgi:hypothetical protein